MTIYEVVDLEAAVERKNSYGGTTPDQVADQLDEAGQRLARRWSSRCASWSNARAERSSLIEAAEIPLTLPLSR